VALPDPLVLTVSGVSKNVPKINDGSYRLIDGANTYTVSITTELPAKNKRNRLRVALKRDALIADPLLTGQNDRASLTVAVTADWDQNHPLADPQTMYNSLLSFLTSATFLRVAGGEM